MLVTQHGRASNGSGTLTKLEVLALKFRAEGFLSHFLVFLRLSLGFGC